MTMINFSNDWFEISADNLERARKFYSEVFDMRTQAANGPEGPIVNLEHEGKPVGAIVMRTGQQPSDIGPLIFFDVRDIDATLQRARQSGGSVLLERTSIGPNGFIGRFADTEGNQVALHSAAGPIS